MAGATSIPAQACETGATQLSDHEITALGASELPLVRLLDALDAVAPRFFALEWAPGRACKEYGGAPAGIFWWWCKARGPWLLLPDCAFSGALGDALVEQLGTPLTEYLAEPLGAGTRLSERRKEPGGKLTYVAITDYEGTPPDDALRVAFDAFRNTPERQEELRLYPAGESLATEAEGSGELDPAMLEELLAVAVAGGGCTIGRSAPDQFRVEAPGAGARGGLTGWLNLLTAERFRARAASEGIVLRPPDVFGPLGRAGALALDPRS